MNFRRFFSIITFLVMLVVCSAAFAAEYQMDEVIDVPLYEDIPDNVPSITNVYPPIEDGFLPICNRGMTTEPIIAITIDDCNQPGNLSEMLRIIYAAGGSATIFPIGENIPMLSKVLTKAVELGFEIENHTMTHSGLYWEDDEGLAYQIWQQDHEIDMMLGYDYRMRFLRPRGGDNKYDQRTHAYMRQMGYCAIAYWSQVGSGNTAANLMANMQPGDIILFHTTDQDLSVIRELVPMLVAKGYRMVTLNEMFDLSENEHAELSGREAPIALMPYRRDEQILRRNDYLHDVYLMQERLTELGYLSCEYNGFFGKSTESALRAFQADNGLDADGVCGPATWNALFEN